MSIFSRIFNRGQTAPEVPQRGSLFWFPQRYIPSDLQLSPSEALSLSAVYGCIRVISEAIASSDWEVYTEIDDIREEVEDDQVAYLLNVRPNPESTAQAFKEALLVQAMVYGNAYAEIVFDVVGRVKELWFLPSETVVPMRDQATGALYYTVRDTAGNVRDIPAEDMLHFRALSSVSQLMGDSPVTRASRSIALTHAAERYALNYYGSNASVGGVLKLPRTLKPEEEQALSDSWNSGRSGVGNSHKTAILPPGVEFQPLGGNAEQSQVVSSRQYSTEDISRYFGVPTYLLNQNTQLPGQNLEGLGLMFIRHTLRPWAKRLTQEVDFKLLSDRSKKFSEIEFEWLTEPGAKERADTYAVYLDKGVMSINEVRDEIHLNEIEGGDEYKGVTTSPPEPIGAPAQSGSMDAMDQQAQGPQSDTVGPEQGLENLYRLVLSNHANRISSREEELRKTLKNGVLAEKIAHAKEWSRGLVERDLNKAGVNAPPGWMSAITAIENGGNASDLAKALTEVRS